MASMTPEGNIMVYEQWDSNKQQYSRNYVTSGVALGGGGVVNFSFYQFEPGLPPMVPPQPQVQIVIATVVNQPGLYGMFRQTACRNLSGDPTQINGYKGGFAYFQVNQGGQWVNAPLTNSAKGPTNAYDVPLGRLAANQADACWMFGNGYYAAVMICRD